MAVSTRNSVDLYKYNESEQYDHQQRLSFTQLIHKRASINSDHQYLVINDQVAYLSDYRIYIYTFNSSTQQFDEPANKEKFKFSSSAGYGSLSSDKKDQFILNPIL